MIIHDPRLDWPSGPSAAELAAIEDEWPVIAAELGELDCVIQIISAAHEPTELDIRRYRRAQRRMLRAMRAYLAREATPADTSSAATPLHARPAWCAVVPRFLPHSLYGCLNCPQGEPNR